MSDASDASAKGIFEAVILTALASHAGEHAAVNDAQLVDELKKLHPHFANVRDAFELAVKTRAQLEQQGIEDALEQIVVPIAESDRELAFTLCVRVMMADGKTEGDEAMVLGTLQELFALSAETVQRHLDEERNRMAT